MWFGAYADCALVVSRASLHSDVLLVLQSEALDPKLNVIDTMVQAAPDAKINDIKSLLGRMMFSGKSMEKSVSLSQCLLSGPVALGDDALRLLFVPSRRS